MNGNWCAALFPDPIQPLLSQGWLASQPGNTITIAVQTEISSARIVVFKIFANQLWKLNWREKWRRSFDNLGFCISSPKQTIENDGKFANNSTTVDIYLLWCDFMFYAFASLLSPFPPLRTALSRNTRIFPNGQYSRFFSFTGWFNILFQAFTPSVR